MSVQQTNDCQQPHVVIEDRFAMIPEALLYDPHISDGAVRVYGALLRHGQDPTNCYPSNQRIGKLIGKAGPSIPRLTKELEDAGWIDRTPRFDPDGAQTSNGYYIRAVLRDTLAVQRGPSSLFGEDLPPQNHEGKESNRERKQKNEMGFEEFWHAHPTRNGKKLGKDHAAKQWNRLGYAARKDCLVAVVNYAESGQIPKDPERWLRDHCYLDWMEPATPTTVGMSAQERQWAEYRRALAERRGDESP